MRTAGLRRCPGHRRRQSCRCAVVGKSHDHPRRRVARSSSGPALRPVSESPEAGPRRMLIAACPAPSSSTAAPTIATAITCSLDLGDQRRASGRNVPRVILLSTSGSGTPETLTLGTPPSTPWWPSRSRRKRCSRSSTACCEAARTRLSGAVDSRPAPFPSLTRAGYSRQSATILVIDAARKEGSPTRRRARGAPARPPL